MYNDNFYNNYASKYDNGNYNNGNYNNGNYNNGNYDNGNYANDPRYYPENSSAVNNKKDYGPAPFVVDIDKTAAHNSNYRTALWTGKYLQVTMMSIPVGGDVGLEIHPDTDQMLYVADGSALVQMGETSDNLSFSQPAYEDSAIFVPAGLWHNLTNTGKAPLKIFTVYAPPHHPWGTVQLTKADAEADEAAENNQL
jgi:mannose-6-phosphate isomerase-like protein (cupin superfamily)